jgi:hypothetical protein
MGRAIGGMMRKSAMVVEGVVDLGWAGIGFGCVKYACWTLTTDGIDIV